jgi:hypothetical protein
MADKLVKCEHKGCERTNPPYTLFNNDGAGFFCAEHHNAREAVKAAKAEKEGEKK